MFQGYLIHIDLQDHVPYFDSFILSNTFMCNLLLVFYFDWQQYFCSKQAGRDELCFYFRLKFSSFLQKFCILVFVQLILSVIHICQLITVQFIATLKHVLSNLSRFISRFLFAFYSWIQVVGELEFCQLFSAFKIAVFSDLIHNKCQPYKILSTGIKLKLFLPIQTCAYIAFCQVLFCIVLLSLALHTKRVNL